MSLDLSAAVAAHHPVKGGSSQSNIRGGYTGDWVICSCDPGDAWSRMATRIPIGEYPAHLLVTAAPLIVAAVREQVAAEIIDVRRTHSRIKGSADSILRRHVEGALRDAAERVLSNAHAEDEYPAGWLDVARGESA